MKNATMLAGGLWGEMEDKMEDFLATKQVAIYDMSSSDSSSREPTAAPVQLKFASSSWLSKLKQAAAAAIERSMAAGTSEVQQQVALKAQRSCWAVLGMKDTAADAADAATVQKKQRMTKVSAGLNITLSAAVQSRLRQLCDAMQQPQSAAENASTVGRVAELLELCDTNKQLGHEVHAAAALTACVVLLLLCSP
jgi:hypothetical protein